MTPVLFDAATDDLEPLAVLHAACFAQGWSAKSLADLLATPDCFAFSVETGRATDAPGGFILARAAGGEAEILTLAVAPPARGRGFGRELVWAAAAHAKTLGASVLFLEVGTGNRAALALYERLGFARIAARKGYYHDGDALVLKADLPLPPEPNIA